MAPAPLLAALTEGVSPQACPCPSSISARGTLPARSWRVRARLSSEGGLLAGRADPAHGSPGRRGPPAPVRDSGNVTRLRTLSSRRVCVSISTWCKPSGLSARQPAHQGWGPWTRRYHGEQDPRIRGGMDAHGSGEPWSLCSRARWPWKVGSPCARTDDAHKVPPVPPVPPVSETRLFPDGISNLSALLSRVTHTGLGRGPSGGRGRCLSVGRAGCSRGVWPCFVPEGVWQPVLSQRHVRVMFQQDARHMALLGPPARPPAPRPPGLSWG